MVTYQTCRDAFVFWYLECMVNVTVIYMCVFNSDNLKKNACSMKHNDYCRLCLFLFLQMFVIFFFFICEVKCVSSFHVSLSM